jgi:hypothetical protein
MRGSGDLLQDSIEVIEDPLIRESEDDVVVVPEIPVSALVIGVLLFPLMNISIELHDNPAISTAEVRHEGSNRVLTDELQAVEIAVAEPLP